MKVLIVAFAMIAVAGCNQATEREASEPAAPMTTGADVSSSSTSVTSPAATDQATTPVESTTSSASDSTSQPPKVDSDSAREPVHLPILGPDIWLVEDWEQPGFVVRTDAAGLIVETLWQQDAEAVGSLYSGHTLVCEDVDADGEIDLVDLRFWFEGDLLDTYRELRELGGATISSHSVPVDGTSGLTASYQICGVSSQGPYLRITAMQWGAALRHAGFTNIAGDHAIDPTYSVIATWEGVEYHPLNLYQGDFKPEPDPGAVVLDCDLGTIEIPSDLDSDARLSLETVAGC